MTTYRLASHTEVYADIEHCWERGEVVADMAARTIASWYMSPGTGSENLTSLAHGLPFDTDGLAVEIDREVTNSDDRDVLTVWLDRLTDLLADVA